MFHYTNGELSIVIAVPIVTIVTLWTLAIFHRNKRKWRPYDITIVAILVEGIFRNATIVLYVIFTKIDLSGWNFDFCAVFVWIFNSLHTFQASCLTTLTIIGLFSVKLYGKSKNLKNYLTGTHVAYHLCCLMTLCACVGVAGILAMSKLTKNCTFMPYELDVKFNVFILALHVFLSVISLVAFLYIICIYWRIKKSGFDYLKKSTSDLSELSQQQDAKPFYDYDQAYNTIWKSDISNISTTVSSTNSRRPLNRVTHEENYHSTGLETIHPVLIVSYIFYHLPVMVFSTFPSLPAPYQPTTVILWLGLVQDILIPIGLGLLDSRFTQWVSNVYRCGDKKAAERKLPHVGLDGKFRHFGSQPQSLEIHNTSNLGQMSPYVHLGQGIGQSPSQGSGQIRNERDLLGDSFQGVQREIQVAPRHVQHVQHVQRAEHAQRAQHTQHAQHAHAAQSGKTGIRCFPSSEPHKFPITNGSLYTSIEGRVPIVHNYRRQSNEKRVKEKRNSFRCTNCTTCTNSDFIRNSVYNLNQQNQLLKPYLRHASLSQTSLKQVPLGVNSSPRTYSRLSKSCDSLNEISELDDLRNLALKTNFSASSLTNLNQLRDSDSEYFSDSVDRDYAVSSSSCSITTEANCDFEFFTKTATPTRRSTVTTGDANKFRITRSNSKRSLENLRAYVECDFYTKPNEKCLNRSSSLISCDAVIRDDGPNRDGVSEANFLEIAPPILRGSKNFYTGSVPDLKKIFISDFL